MFRRGKIRTFVSAVLVVVLIFTAVPLDVFAMQVKAETIIPVYDEIAQTLTFETDRFSTYAITYTDIPTDIDLPETGVKNYIWLWATIAVISGGILIAIPVVLLKKKKDSEDK